MPVKWENVTIPFTQGMDRSVDDYLASPGAVYEAKNLVASDKNTLQGIAPYGTKRSLSTANSGVVRCIAVPGGGSVAEYGHTSYSAEAVALSSEFLEPITANERIGIDSVWRGGKASLFDATAVSDYIIMAWVDDEEYSINETKYVEIRASKKSDGKEVRRIRVAIDADGYAIEGIRVSADGSATSNYALMALRTLGHIHLIGVYTDSDSRLQAGTASRIVSAAPTMHDTSFGACFDAHPGSAITKCKLAYVEDDPGAGNHLLKVSEVTIGSPCSVTTAPSASITGEVNTNLALGGAAGAMIAFGKYAGNIETWNSGDGVSTAPTSLSSVTVTHPGRMAFNRTGSSAGTSGVLYYESLGAAFPQAPYIDASYVASTTNGMQHFTESCAVRRADISAGSPSNDCAVNAHGFLASTPALTYSGATLVEEAVSVIENDAWTPSQLVLTRDSTYAAPSYHSCVAEETAVGYSADYIGVSTTASHKRGGREPVPQLCSLSVYQGAWALVHAPAGDDVNPAFGGLAKKSTTSTPAAPYVPDRVVRLTTLRRSLALGACQALGTVWCAGSKQKQFSGGAFADELLAPPILYGGTTDTEKIYGSPLTNAKDYLFCATFVVPDASGNYVETAPSPSYEYTTTGLASGTECMIANIRPTRTALIQGCKLRLYRTSGADLVTFYLDSEYDAAALVAGGVVQSSTDDSLITSSKVLYTQQGEAGNAAPPKCHDIIEHQNRLFCTDGYEIRVTKPLAPGVGPRWLSRSVRVDVPDTFGRAVKLISMDEKLLVFCERKVGVVDGGGPTLDGLGATFSELSEVSQTGTPWGAVRSFVQTDDGVWWQSNRGIRLFTRGYQVATDEQGEVGRQVDELLFSDYPIANTTGLTQHVVGTAYNEGVVRWLIRDENTLSFALPTTFGIAYHKGAFTTFDAANAAGMVAVTDSEFHVAGRSGVNYWPVAGAHAYNFQSPRIDTGWLQLDERMEDYQRVRKVIIEGQMQAQAGYSGTASKGWLFTVTAQYDYQVGSTATTEVSGQAVTPAYGAAGNTWYNFRFEVSLNVQKCSSLRLVVSATPNAYARDIRLTSMSLEVGRKRGMGKKLSSTERL